MKTKILFSFAFSFATFISAPAQIKFTRLFWQNIGEVIRSTSVVELSGGGYLMAGTVKDSAAGSLTDLFLAKFSQAGDTVWTTRIAATGNQSVDDIRQTSDGGYILTGYSDETGFKMLLLKTDSLGQFTWAKVFGGAATSFGYSVRQNADGGYVVSGKTYVSGEKALVVRTNSMGDTLWTKTYDLGSYSRASFAVETAAGDFMIAMEADSNIFDQYVVLLKVNSSGTPVWAKKVTAFTSMFDTHDIQQTMDGGYMLTAEESPTMATPIVLKFDSSGNYIFGKYFLCDATVIYLLKATQRADSTYDVVASFYSSFGNGGTLILRLDQAGDTISTSKLPDIYFLNGGSFTNDGGFVATDYYNGIHKLDSSFNTECQSPGMNPYTAYYNYTCSNSLPLSNGGTTVTSAAFTNLANVTRRLYTPCTPNVPTCVVTVDSATQKNIVIWEENFDSTFVDSYQVYKESAAAGVYNLIGNVPLAQFSTFIDTVSNPAVQAERYRVSALWHSVYEPPNFIPGHKTIHLSISPGIPPAINLNWSSYEGFNYPTYNIWRGNSSSAGIIASVPFGTNNYTDLTPPVGDSLYFIEVVHGPCNPTFMQLQYNATVSNRVSNNFFVGMNEAERLSSIYLYPNPTASSFAIINSSMNRHAILEIFNTFGEAIYSGSLDGMKDKAINLDLAAGIYMVIMSGEQGRVIRKLVVE